MNDFETWANYLSDMDREWWPFLFLRPEQTRRMTTARVAVISALYGVFAGLFANASIALSGKAAGLNPFLFPVSATVIFFVVFRVTFAYFWNRRVERMTRSRERAS